MKPEDEPLARALSAGKTFYYYVEAYNSAGTTFAASYVYATTYR